MATIVYDAKNSRMVRAEMFVKGNIEDDFFGNMIIDIMREGSEWSLLYLLDGQSEFHGDFHYQGTKRFFDCENKKIDWMLRNLALLIHDQNLFGKFSIPPYEKFFEITACKSNYGQIKLLYSLVAFLCQAKEEGFSEVYDLGSGVGLGGMNHAVALDLAPVARVIAYDQEAVNDVVMVGKTEVESHRSSVPVNFDCCGKPAYCDIYFNGDWEAIQNSVKSPLVMKKKIDGCVGGNIFQPYHTEMRAMRGFGQLNALMGAPMYEGFECACWPCRLWNALIFRYQLNSCVLAGNLLKMGKRPDSSVPGAKAILGAVQLDKNYGRVNVLVHDPVRISHRHIDPVVVVEKLEVERALVVIARNVGSMCNMTGRVMRDPILNVFGGIPIFEDEVSYPCRSFVCITGGAPDGHPDIVERVGDEFVAYYDSGIGGQHVPLECLRDPPKKSLLRPLFVRKGFAFYSAVMDGLSFVLSEGFYIKQPVLDLHLVGYRKGMFIDPGACAELVDLYSHNPPVKPEVGRVDSVDEESWD